MIVHEPWHECRIVDKVIAKRDNLKNFPAFQLMHLLASRRIKDDKIARVSEQCSWLDQGGADVA